jgi:hypothetical protein
MHTVRVKSTVPEPRMAHSSLELCSSTLQTPLDEINVQPNFSQMLNMDRLSIHDSTESGFASSHSSAQPPSPRKSSKKSDIISGSMHMVKKNSETFKSGRERLSRAGPFCEVPDALLAARAARIITRRGNSHRPPPTRYIRRQRSAIEPMMVVTTTEDTVKPSEESNRATLVRSESENQVFLNACFEVRFDFFLFCFTRHSF